MKRVAGYVRVSRVAGRQGESFQSPDAQEDAIRTHCKARKLEVVEVVRELDVSGGTMQRKELQRLIREIEAGTLDGVVVAKLDRFARTLVGGIQALERIHTAGGFVQTVEGGIDTSASGGAMATMQLNMLLTFGQWQKDSLAEGLESAKQRAVGRGVHISGTVPVGYLRPNQGGRLELDKVKAPAIRAAFKLRASGAAYGDVVRLLDRRLPGGPSGHGVWNRNTVKRLLSNRAYIGEARQGEYVHPDAHPAIVSRTVFDTVQALAHRREPNAAPGAKSLLAGVVICGSCGHALDRNKVGGKYWVYRCRGRSASGVCQQPSTAMADTLDTHVTDAVLDRLDGYAVEQVASDNDLTELHGRIAAARTLRAPFEDPHYVAVLGVEAAARALAKVDAELDALERELAAAVDRSAVWPEGTRAPTALQDVRELWPTLATDERRQIIRSMVDAVTVSRGPTRMTPLTDRVALNWKGGIPVARPSRGRRRNSTEVVAGMTAA